jgi:hypothetical protein
MTGLRIEWAEGRARVERWSEEIALRLEEMVRSIRGLLYKSQTWKSRISSRKDISLSTIRGLDSFASRQSAVYEGLAYSFYSMWRSTVQQLGLAVDWPSSIVSVPPSTMSDGLVDKAVLASIPNFRADILDDVNKEISEDAAQDQNGEFMALYYFDLASCNGVLESGNDLDDNNNGAYIHNVDGDDNDGDDDDF